MFAYDPSSSGYSVPGSMMMPHGSVGTVGAIPSRNPGNLGGYGLSTSDGLSIGGSGNFAPNATMSGAMGMNYAVSTDEIRTIFVTGFPPDLKDRELHNLCSFLPGYEASQMSQKGGQPQGFALFSSAAHAIQAVEAIIGFPFDTISASSSAQTSANTSTALPPPLGASTVIIQGSQSNMDNLVETAQGGERGEESTPANAATTQLLSTASSVLGSGENGNNLSLISGNSTGGLNKQLMTRNSGANSAAGTVYKLRAEMAHKNMYIKDGDTSIRKASRPYLLLPDPSNALFGSGPGYTANGGSSYGARQNARGISALGHVGLSSMNNRLNQGAGTDPITGGRMGGALGGTTGAGGLGGGLHPLAAAAAGLPTQVITTMAAGNNGMVGGAGGMMSNATAMPALGPVGFLPVANRNDNAPCNTLFIGNLSDQVSEMELMGLFSVQAGFKQMKLVRGPKQVSCFVEFDDVVSAVSVHSAYQGAVLPSSDRGGIRIQYSKNPFGRRYGLPSQPEGTSQAGGAGGGMTFMGAGMSGMDSLNSNSYTQVSGWQPSIPLHLQGQSQQQQQQQQQQAQLQAQQQQLQQQQQQQHQSQPLYGGLMGVQQQVQLQQPMQLYY